MRIEKFSSFALNGVYFMHPHSMTIICKSHVYGYAGATWL